VRRVLGPVVVFLLVASPSCALAAGEVTLYEAGLGEPKPAGIAAGPDGNLWFTGEGVNGSAGIGTITTAGALTEHHLENSQSAVSAITAGPDKALWFTQGNQIGRITTANPAKVEYTTVKGEGQAWRIAESKSAGGTPDGNLWFTMHGSPTHKIEEINDSTHTITEVELSGVEQPEDIVGGPEGDLWVTVPASHEIVRVNPNNTSEQKPFEIEGGLEPAGITASEGALWFTAKNAVAVGRMIPNHEEAPRVKITSVIPPGGAGAGVSTNEIAVGPKGALWFTYSGLNQIGQLRPEQLTEGTVSEGGFAAWPISGTSAKEGAGGIAEGPDGNMWFTLRAAGKVGRISTAEVTIAPETPPRLEVSIAGVGPTEGLGYGTERAYLAEAGVAQTFTAIVHGSRPGANLEYTWTTGPHVRCGAEGYSESLPACINEEHPRAGPSFAYTPLEAPPEYPNHLGYVRVLVNERYKYSNGIVETRPAAGTVLVKIKPEAETCRHRLEFALTLVTVTPGCLKPVSGKPDEFETTAPAHVNGILLTPPPGTKLIVTVPKSTSEGGHIEVKATIPVHVAGFTLHLALSGGLALPGGKQGEEGTVTELGTPEGTEAGLKFAGGVVLTFAFKEGRHYSNFKLTLELPKVFKKGAVDGGVTGEGSVKVEASPSGGESTVQFNGLKLQVKNIYIGKLEVEEACFAYLPRGATGITCCPRPGANGAEFIQCSENTNANRWAGSASVILPTSSSPKITAFGALEEGKLANLGGSVSNLGRALPIAPNVYLNSISLGLCLKPPPLKAKGEVGVSVFPVDSGPAAVEINGHVEYVEQYEGTPWHVELGGNVLAAGRQVGEGHVVIFSTGTFEFEVNAGMRFSGEVLGKTVEVASLKGMLGGWVEPSSERFNVDGSIQACIQLFELGCASAEVLVNNSAIAGCGRFGGIEGFIAYRWGWKEPEISLSCNLGPYEEAKASSARASAQSGGARTVLVAPGTHEIAFRVHGMSGPPNLTVSGPGGARILSPSAGVLEKAAHSVVLEDPANDTTSVLLIAPAAGAWRLEASTPDPLTGVEVARYQQPAHVAGVVRGSGPRRTLEITYTVPAGSEISLTERGGEVSHEVSRSLRGGRCRKRPAPLAGESVRCATLSFAPIAARTTARKLLAIVSRGGLPQRVITIASFRGVRLAPAPTPGALQLKRKGRSLTLTWRAGSSPKEFDVVAKLSSGRQLSYAVKGGCRALRIPGVGKKLTASLRITAVRAGDLTAGRTVHLTIKGAESRSGANYRVQGKVCG